MLLFLYLDVCVLPKLPTHCSCQSLCRSSSSILSIMCRWITLISADRYSLSDVVLAPSNSLVQLSRDASFHPDFTDANNAIMNGDGFGIGTLRAFVAKSGLCDFVLVVL